jgi:hypothetical protein
MPPELNSCMNSHTRAHSTDRISQHEHGTDLNEIDVDAQRVFRLSRPEASNNPGAKVNLQPFLVGSVTHCFDV